MDIVGEWRRELGAAQAETAAIQAAADERAPKAAHRAEDLDEAAKASQPTGPETYMSSGVLTSSFLVREIALHPSSPRGCSQVVQVIWDGLWNEVGQ